MKDHPKGIAAKYRDPISKVTLCRVTNYVWVTNSSSPCGGLHLCDTHIALYVLDVNELNLIIRTGHQIPVQKQLKLN